MVPLLPADTQVLAGLKLGGVPIATTVSALTGLPAIFVRKQAKTYGTCRLAEGCDFATRLVTLIEDIITTGGAARTAAIALRELDATVHTVVCAIDRSVPDANTLYEIGLSTVSVMTMTVLNAAQLKTESAQPLKKSGATARTGHPVLPRSGWFGLLPTGSCVGH